MAFRRLCTQLLLLFSVDFAFLYLYRIQCLCLSTFGSCLLSIFAVFIVWVYCGKDFQSLGRHTWRCKKSLNNRSEPNEPKKTTAKLDSEPVSGCNIIKCVCGKECKGVKGQKMHQRRCGALDNMESSQAPQFEHSNNDPREVAIERQQEEKAIESPCKSTNETSKNFQKYSNFTVKQLKKELAKFRRQGSALPDINYVPGLLRSKLKTTASVSNK